MGGLRRPRETTLFNQGGSIGHAELSSRKKNLRDATLQFIKLGKILRSRKKKKSAPVPVERSTQTGRVAGKGKRAVLIARKKFKLEEKITAILVEESSGARRKEGGNISSDFLK